MTDNNANNGSSTRAFAGVPDLSGDFSKSAVRGAVSTDHEFDRFAAIDLGAGLAKLRQ